MPEGYVQLGKSYIPEEPEYFERLLPKLTHTDLAAVEQLYRDRRALAERRLRELEDSRASLKAKRKALSQAPLDTPGLLEKVQKGAQLEDNISLMIQHADLRRAKMEQLLQVILNEKITANETGREIAKVLWRYSGANLMGDPFGFLEYRGVTDPDLEQRYIVDEEGRLTEGARTGLTGRFYAGFTSENFQKDSRTSGYDAWLANGGIFGFFRNGAENIAENVNLNIRNLGEGNYGELAKQLVPGWGFTENITRADVAREDKPLAVGLTGLGGELLAPAGPLSTVRGVGKGLGVLGAVTKVEKAVKVGEAIEKGARYSRLPGVGRFFARGQEFVEGLTKTKRTGALTKLLPATAGGVAGAVYGGETAEDKIEGGLAGAVAGYGAGALGLASARLAGKLGVGRSLKEGAFFHEVFQGVIEHPPTYSELIEHWIAQSVPDSAKAAVIAGDLRTAESLVLEHARNTADAVLTAKVRETVNQSLDNPKSFWKNLRGKRVRRKDKNRILEILNREFPEFAEHLDPSRKNTQSAVATALLRSDPEARGGNELWDVLHPQNDGEELFGGLLDAQSLTEEEASRFAQVHLIKEEVSKILGKEFDLEELARSDLEISQAAEIRHEVRQDFYERLFNEAEELHRVAEHLNNLEAFEFSAVIGDGYTNRVLREQTPMFPQGATVGALIDWFGAEAGKLTETTGKIIDIIPGPGDWHYKIQFADRTALVPESRIHGVIHGLFEPGGAGISRREHMVTLATAELGEVGPSFERLNEVSSSAGVLGEMAGKVPEKAGKPKGALIELAERSQKEVKEAARFSDGDEVHFNFGAGENRTGRIISSRQGKRGRVYEMQYIDRNNKVAKATIPEHQISAKPDVSFVPPEEAAPAGAETVVQIADTPKFVEGQIVRWASGTGNIKAVNTGTVVSESKPGIYLVKDKRTGRLFEIPSGELTHSGEAVRTKDTVEKIRLGNLRRAAVREAAANYGAEKAKVWADQVARGEIRHPGKGFVRALEQVKRRGEAEYLGHFESGTLDLIGAPEPVLPTGETVAAKAKRAVPAGAQSVADRVVPESKLLGEMAKRDAFYGTIEALAEFRKLAKEKGITVEEALLREIRTRPELKDLIDSPEVKDIISRLDSNTVLAETNKASGLTGKEVEDLSRGSVPEGTGATAEATPYSKVTKASGEKSARTGERGKILGLGWGTETNPSAGYIMQDSWLRKQIIERNIQPGTPEAEALARDAVGRKKLYDEEKKKFWELMAKYPGYQKIAAAVEAGDPSAWKDVLDPVDVLRWLKQNGHTITEERAKMVLQQLNSVNHRKLTKGMEKELRKLKILVAIGGVSLGTQVILGNDDEDVGDHAVMASFGDESSIGRIYRAIARALGTHEARMNHATKITTEMLDHLQRMKVDLEAAYQRHGLTKQSREVIADLNLAMRLSSGSSAMREAINAQLAAAVGTHEIPFGGPWVRSVGNKIQNIARYAGPLPRNTVYGIRQAQALEHKFVRPISEVADHMIRRLSPERRRALFHAIEDGTVAKIADPYERRLGDFLIDSFESLFKMQNDLRAMQGRRPIPRRKGYITHFFTSVSEDRWKNATESFKVLNPYEQIRKGRTGYIDDAAEAFGVYFRTASREMLYGHLERDYNLYRSFLSPSVQRVMDGILRLSTGKYRSLMDRVTFDFLGKGAMNAAAFAGKSDAAAVAVGRRVQRRAEDVWNLLGSVVYFTALAGSQKSALLNLGQSLHSVAGIGPRSTFKALGDVVEHGIGTNVVGAVAGGVVGASSGDTFGEKLGYGALGALTGNMAGRQIGKVLAHARAARALELNKLIEKIVPDLDESVSHAHRHEFGVMQTIWNSILDSPVGMGMFSEAEKFNRRVAALAGYYEAEARGLAGNAAIEFARDAVERTQFWSYKGNQPGLISSLGNFGRPFAAFKSFPLRSAELFKSETEAFIRATKSGDTKEAKRIATNLATSFLMTAGVIYGASGMDIFVNDETGVTPLEMYTAVAQGRAFVGDNVSDIVVNNVKNAVNGPMAQFLGEHIKKVSGADADLEEAYRQFFLPAQVRRMQKVMALPPLNENPIGVARLGGKEVFLTSKSKMSTGVEATETRKYYKAMGFRSKEETDQQDAARLRATRRVEIRDKAAALLVKARDAILRREPEKARVYVRELAALNYYSSSEELINAVRRSVQWASMTPMQREIARSPRMLKYGE